MVKQISYTYQGMNQDVSKTKHPFQFYFEANNVRITSNDSQATGSITNEKGNSLFLSIPTPVINTTAKLVHYGNKSIPYTTDELLSKVSDTQIIISHTLTREGVILFTTDNKGFDCIWEIENILENDYSLKLLYTRNLNFSTSNPIQSLFNYENTKIQKVYWCDGLKQLKFINIKHSTVNGDLEELMDLKVNSLNIVGYFDVSQPVVTEIQSAGTHTSGVIQYAYNLYRLNGSQTIISPLSDLVSLDKGTGQGGGEINELLTVAPVVKIATLDKNFTHIKLYSIKYTSYNQTPSVNLIVDSEINNYTDFTYFDDGSIISSSSLSEFLFLGSNPLIPKHISTKYNRLFAANLKEEQFDFEIDTRAYSFSSSMVAKIKSLENIESTIDSSTYNVPLKHDCINPDYKIYKYQSNGILLGGEGKFIKYNLIQKQENQLSISLKYAKFFKDGEIYRIGIQFYNKLGQISSVSWIADFVAPVGNLSNNYNTIQVSLKTVEFEAYVNSLNLNDENKPVGYKIVRADRTLNDRTIIAQGVLGGMIVQTPRKVTDDLYWSDENNKIQESKEKVKIPTPLLRNFNTKINPVDNYSNLLRIAKAEIYKSDRDISNTRKHVSWQYNKMMQMYSPDITFGDVTFGSDLKLKIKGVSKINKTDAWYKKINISNLNEEINEKSEIDTDYFEVVDDEWGLISQCRSMRGSQNRTTEFKMKFLNIHRTFDTLVPSNGYEVDIFGVPEITERGQGITAYNGNSEFNYTNSFENFLSDTRNRIHTKNTDDVGITGINSYGAKCVTLMEGAFGAPESSRKTLEQLYSNSGLGNNDGLLVVDIKKDDSYLYNGNIYGGRSYEDKTRTSYLEIGNYCTVTKATIDIDSPGDTFVQKFNVARVSKTDKEVYDKRKIQLTEIIEVVLETSINLDNRNDISLNGWDNKFQPQYSEYHNYNKVYSQIKGPIERVTKLYKFKTINEFDTRIIASKVKIPGEFIDSWTDFLENEVIDLDAKNGSLNALVTLNDNMYAFQDSAIAHISISPRVQTQGNDGISIELGSGSVLHDYQYLSTKSGTLNKWSIFESPLGLYFFDIYNKSISIINGASIQSFSDTKGMHSFFHKNINYNVLKLDNPILKTGVTGVYDNINNTALFTILQDDNSYTIGYNEISNTFISFYDYKPSMYINKGFKLLALHPDNNKIYEQYKGNYNEFFGVKYKSNIVLQLNPQDGDCIFENIAYKSEVSKDGIDINQSLTHIKAWNEYQTTVLTPFVLNSNLSRRFRLWKGNIPRVSKNNKLTLERLRGHWIKLQLDFENPDNYKLVLHDMTISYSAHFN